MTALKPRADSARHYILTLLVAAFIIMINTFGESRAFFTAAQRPQ